ncbi:MAG: hypothetical protein IJL32_04480 [Oscillospiraceae bacterium]|nr:hypothetical protein [Oscillospiraceae bacterium]
MKYSNLSMSFWTDSKIDDDFTPEDKYFFLYLLSNPHTSVTGCYEISMKQMERETGYNTDTITRLIQRMQDVHKVIKYDQETKEVLIVNWYKYNWTKSENLIKSVIRVAQFIKSSDFKKYVLDMVFIRYGYRMETSDSESDSESDSDTDSDTDTDTDTDSECMAAAEPRRPRSQFKPPSVDEVRAYCQERKNSIDPQRFVDFYTANGWVQGKGKPIQDWRAVVRLWESKEAEFKSRAAPANKGCYSSIDDAVFEKIMNPYGVSSIDESDVEKIMNPYGAGVKTGGAS